MQAIEPQSPDEFVMQWCQAIDAARAEEKDWRENAEKANEVYCGKKPDQHFNIYHSNVETTVPAIYNSTPVPDIRRRYGDKGIVEKTIADMIERGLQYGADAYDLDGALRAAVYDMVIAGRGVLRVRYKPTLSEDRAKVIGQAVTCEVVPWKSFIRGPGRAWEDVPFVAFEHFLTRAQIAELNPEFVDDAAFVYSASTLDAKNGHKDQQAPQRFQCARVFEIWDKATKTVIFLSPEAKDRPILIDEDPLKLEAFFPVPRPMHWAMEPGSLVPICGHAIYERLMADLDKVSARIAKLVKQVRPRGGYIGTYPDMKTISEADDGELVPLSGIDQMMTSGGGGIEKAITWFPLEPVILAIRELVTHREMIKQQIYEVTGISDIIRGATKATETATAQNIKANFASQRMQQMIAEVARFARDLFRLKAEVMCQEYKPETWFEMTNIQLLTEAQKAQIGQMQEADPQQAEALAKQQPKLLEAFKRPSLEKVMEIMRSDARRAYRIDIETDSTIRSDVQRFQQQSAQFLQGTTAYIQAMGPLVQQGVLPPDMAIELFLAFARQFKLGKTTEDALEQLRSQAQEYGPQMMQKAQAEQQAKEGGSKEDAQAKMEIERTKMQLEAEKIRAEQQIKAQELEMKRYEIELQDQRERVKADQEMNYKVQAAAMKTQAERERHSMTLEASQKPAVMVQTDAKAALEGTAAALQGMAAENSNALAAAMQSISQAVNALAMPKRIVRDPKTGRALGVEVAQ